MCTKNVPNTGKKSIKNRFLFLDNNNVQKLKKF